MALFCKFKIRGPKWWNVSTVNNGGKLYSHKINDYLNHLGLWRHLCMTYYLYSQTWVNDHLRIATTCQQRPLFWATTTTTCQQRPLFLGPKGGRWTQVWLYSFSSFLKTHSEDESEDFWSEKISNEGTRKCFLKNLCKNQH